MSSLTVGTSLFPENGGWGFGSGDWPKLFVPESRVEPIPKPSRLPRDAASARRSSTESQPIRASTSSSALGRASPDGWGADQVEHQIERLRVVARVVDAAVRRLVRHLLGLHVVLPAQLDAGEAEPVGDGGDDPLGGPEGRAPR